MNYNVWIKNLPKNMRVPRARYDSRNLIKDINININISGFDFSSFVPTAPIQRPRPQYVDPRYEESIADSIPSVEPQPQRTPPPPQVFDIPPDIVRQRRDEINAQDRAPQLRREQVYRERTGRWVDINGVTGRQALTENPLANRRFV